MTGPLEKCVNRNLPRSWTPPISIKRWKFDIQWIGLWKRHPKVSLSQTSYTICLNIGLCALQYLSLFVDEFIPETGGWLIPFTISRKRNMWGWRSPPPRFLCEGYDPVQSRVLSSNSSSGNWRHELRIFRVSFTMILGLDHVE